VRDWVWPDAGETGTEVGGPQQNASVTTGGDNE
jgi:xylulose-5-phosphate/fructose-6-phosphate phosphoketolase